MLKLPMPFETFQPPWPFRRVAGFGWKGAIGMGRDEHPWGPSTPRHHARITRQIGEALRSEVVTKGKADWSQKPLLTTARRSLRSPRCSPIVMTTPCTMQMTVVRLWDRLNPTAPQLAGLSWFPSALGIASILLVGVVSSSDTGPLFTRKGQHALDTRSATKRSAQRAASSSSAHF
jgi:hypothetical protein